MFKADLIEYEKFYSIRRKVAIIGFPFAILGFIYVPWKKPLWLEIIGLIIMIGFLIYQSYLMRNMRGFKKNKEIVIDGSEIKIKTNRDEIESQYPVYNADKIIVREKYLLDEEIQKQYLKLFRGNYYKNFIKLVQGEQIKNFEFSIDSYYKVVQLQKIIDQWKEKKYPLEIIE